MMFDTLRIGQALALAYFSVTLDIRVLPILISESIWH